MVNNGLSISFSLNPVFNVDAFNSILSVVKSSLGALGKDIQPIDAKAFEKAQAAIKAQTAGLKDNAKILGILNDEAEDLAGNLTTTGKVDVDASEAVSGLKSVKSGLDEVVAGLDDVKGKGDNVLPPETIKPFADELKNVVKGLEGVNGITVGDNVKQMATEYDNAVSKMQASLNVQKSALAAMRATGQEGSESYKQIQAEVLRATEEINRFKTANEETESEIAAIMEANHKAFNIEMIGPFYSELQGVVKGFKELSSIEIDSDIQKMANEYDKTLASMRSSLDVQKKALVAMRATGQEGSESYKQLETEILKATDELERFKSANDETEKQLSSLAEAAKKAFEIEVIGKFNDELNKVTAGLKDINGIDIDVDVSKMANEYDRVVTGLNASLSAQKKALATMRATGQEGSESYKQLEDQIGRTEEEIKRFKLEAEQVEVKVDGAETFVDIAAKFEALSGLGEKISSFAESGIEFRNALSEVAAQTGATADEMDVLEAAALRAFRAGVGESAADAVKAIGMAKQTLGQFLPTEEIEKFTVKAQGIANVFDKDINEVVQGSRTFIAQFGLDGEKAGNLVAYAMQQTGSKMDDTLDTLDEYSQLIKTAGFSAEQFVGVITAGMQKGVRDTDKLADAIKETQIRLNAGDTSKALAGITSPITQSIQDIVKLAETGQISIAEMMQKATETIGNAENAGQISASIRDQLSVALSGTMAEDIGGKLYTEIFSAPIDTSVIDAKAKEAGESMSNAVASVNWFDNVQRQVEGFAMGFKTSISGLAAPVGSLLTSISSVAPGLMLLQNFSLKDSVKDMKELGTSAVQFGLSILKRVVPALVAEGAAEGALTINKEALTIATAKQAIADGIATVSKGVHTGATMVLTGAQWALNAAFLASPIGWVVAGVALLVGSFVLLYNNVEPVRKIFDTLWVGITAGLTAAWEMIKGFAGGFAKLFTGDFSGAIESFGSIGSDGAKAFGESFNKGMDDNNWEDSTNKMKEALEKGSQVSLKIDANLDFKNLVGEYEKAKARIDQLNAKKNSTGLTDAEKKDLAALEQQAQQTAEKIGKIAPETKTNMKSVVDASGNLKEVWDVNIAKAKEYANASSGGSLAESAKEYSDALMTQSGVIDNQIGRQKELKKQIDATNDPEKKQELIDKYNEENKAIEKNKATLLEAFTKGAQAGLVTEDAIKKIAKQMGVTSGEAKKMLLAKELEEASKKGKLTESAIEKIAKKYGYTKEQAKALTEEQKKQTAEADKTAKAVANIGQQYDENLKKLNEQVNYNKLEWEALQAKIARGEELSAQEKERLKVLPKYLDADSKALVNADKLRQAADKRWKTTYEEKKASESVYELMKSQLDNSKKQIESDVTRLNNSAKEKANAEQRLQTQAELQRLEIEGESMRLKSLQALAPLYEKLQEKAKIAPDNETRKKQIAEAAQFAADYSLAVQTQINKVGELEIKFNYDEIKAKEELAKLKRDMAKDRIEINLSIGKISETEALEQEVDLLTQELSDKQIKLSVASNDTERAQVEGDILKLAKEIDDKTRALDDSRRRDRFASIKDEAEQEKEIRLYELGQAYAEELRAAGASITKQKEAFHKFQAEKFNIEQDYLARSSGLAANAYRDIADSVLNSMRNITFKDNSDEVKQNLDNLKTQEKDLRDSLARQEISRREFYDKMQDIEKQKLEESGKLQNQYWVGFKSAMEKSFSDISEKFFVSANASLEKYQNFQRSAAEAQSTMAMAASQGNIFEMTKQAKVLTDTTAASTKFSGKMWAELGIAVGATMGQMIAANKSAGKAFVMTTLTALKTVVPMYVAMTYGEEISKLGPVGIATASAATAVFIGLVAVAEQAVAKAKFWRGVVNFRGKGTGTSDDNHVMISNGESVLTAKATAKPENAALFRWMNETGGSVYNWMKTRQKLINSANYQRDAYMEKADYFKEKRSSAANSKDLQEMKAQNAIIIQQNQRLIELAEQNASKPAMRGQTDHRLILDDKGLIKQIKREEKVKLSLM